MVIVAAVVYQNGEPKRLIYGTDWMGRTCGVKADAKGDVPAYNFTDCKYLIYSRLGEDLLALELQDGGASSISFADTSVLKKFYSVCAPKCPMTNDSITGVYVHACKDYKTHTDPVNVLDTSLGATIEDESCAPDEEAYYQSGGITARTCGTSCTLNPLIDCKEKDCTDVVLAVRANCTSIESTKQEKQVTAVRQDPVNEMLSRKWYMVARWIGTMSKTRTTLAFPTQSFCVELSKGSYKAHSPPVIAQFGRECEALDPSDRPIAAHVLTRLQRSVVSHDAHL
ncbi:hypothetical protein FI667_g11815, partial [Globisporangium splendens]